LTQSIQPYTNVGTVIEDLIGSSRVNYIYIASSQNGFLLLDLSIAVNLSKCEKTLCSLYKGEKAPHDSFYKDEQFLYSGVSTHFTPFESDFVDMTLGNYGQVKTANSKVLLFMVASGTVLIEHEIFDPKKETTKIAVSKLWLVYYVPSM